MKNGVFWEVTTSVVPNTPILVTLMKEALSFSDPHGVTSQKTPFFRPFMIYWVSLRNFI
jgi:hypothetical protein